MSEIVCLRCKIPLDEEVEACPECGEKVTSFQRTYSNRLIDGKYQILERLGIGGMGEIFKVRHIHLNEERVIKIMRANIASDDQALQRFLHEARTSTMIKHPNLAMLYDFSTLEDGSYYMVWEYIDGTNLQKWMAANGSFPSRLALEVAIQTLHGLDHLHQMGLIHRDVSPENIMLSQDYHGRLLVKVIDFGIAKQLSEGGSGQGLTQTGMFLGKLKYASPEQAGFLKEGEHLDARSDIYSFGVVFYEMLAGRAPFIASNPQGYILKHATEKPQPIISVNAAAEVPSALEQEVLRSLEKDREQRHSTAADYAEDLESLRELIPPDAKYGLGDARVTVNRPLGERTRGGGRQPVGAKTTPPFAVTGTGPAPTLVGEGDATVSEPVGRAEVAQTLAGERTAINPFGTGEAEATLIDKRGTLATSEAEATISERIGVPPVRTRRTGSILAIAAGGALVVATLAWFSLRPGTVGPGPGPGPNPTPPPNTTTMASTDVLPPVGPIEGGEGLLVLNASPFGEIEQIIRADTGESIPLTADERSTPLRKPLPPGTYELTVMDDKGANSRKISVIVEAGKTTPQYVDFQKLDLDEVSKRILNP